MHLESLIKDVCDRTDNRRSRVFVSFPSAPSVNNARFRSADASGRRAAAVHSSANRARWLSSRRSRRGAGVLPPRRGVPGGDAAAGDARRGRRRRRARGRRASSCGVASSAVRARSSPFLHFPSRRFFRAPRRRPRARPPLTRRSSTPPPPPRVLLAGAPRVIASLVPGRVESVPLNVLLTDDAHAARPRCATTAAAGPGSGSGSSRGPARRRAVHASATSAPTSSARPDAGGPSAMETDDPSSAEEDSGDDDVVLLPLVFVAIVRLVRIVRHLGSGDDVDDATPARSPPAPPPVPSRRSSATTPRASRRASTPRASASRRARGSSPRRTTTPRRQRTLVGVPLPNLRLQDLQPLLDPALVPWTGALRPGSCAHPPGPRARVARRSGLRPHRWPAPSSSRRCSAGGR